MLTGAVNPSGHLPVTFIDNLEQLPHPQTPAKGDVRYTEGSVVGYRWFDAKGHTPAFAFGHGLSYTSFSFTGLAARNASGVVTVSFRVANTGKAAGSDVPQVYVSGPGLDAPKRLAGFAKVDLAPGKSKAVSIAIYPRMFASFKRAEGKGRLVGGTYQIHLAKSSRDIVSSMSITLPAMTVPKDF